MNEKYEKKQLKRKMKTEILQSQHELLNKANGNNLGQNDANENDEQEKILLQTIKNTQDYLKQQFHSTVSNCKNLPSKLKIKIQTLDSNFCKIDDFFLKQNKFPVKSNKFMKDVINGIFNQYKQLHNLIEQLNQLKCCSCCAKEKILKYFIPVVKQLKQYCSFLDILQGMNPKTEKILLKFDSLSYKKQVNQILNAYLPEKIEPEIKIERVEVEVEKPVVTVVKEKETETVRIFDNLREAHELLLGLARPINVSKALEIYQAEANKNNIIAINCLGQINFEGINQPQNIRQAFNYYLQSAKNNNSEGWYQIGKMFENGSLSQQQKEIFCSSFSNNFNQNQNNLLIAVNCYQLAGDCHAGALTQLGSIYEENHIPEGIIQNYKDAKIYYEKASKMNYPLAQNNLGKLQITFDKKQTNFFNQQDSAQAIQNFELAYTQQLPQASLNLGICYERGYGVKVDLQQAIKYFKEAHQKGEERGQYFYSYYMLKQAYQDSNLDNSAKSEQYLMCLKNFLSVYEKNSDQSDCLYFLGYIFENGLGISQDIGNAVKFYEKSTKCTQPSPAGLNRVGDLYATGYYQIDNKEAMNKAFQYYQQSAKYQNTAALRNLGILYEKGYIGEPNYQEAENYYKKAANFGDSDANFYLAQLYEKNLDLNDANCEYIQKIYEKAAAQGSLPAQVIAEDNIIVQTDFTNQINDIYVQMLDEDPKLQEMHFSKIKQSQINFMDKFY